MSQHTLLGRVNTCIDYYVKPIFLFNPILTTNLGSKTLNISNTPTKESCLLRPPPLGRCCETRPGGVDSHLYTCLMVELSKEHSYNAFRVFIMQTIRSLLPIIKPQAHIWKKETTKTNKTQYGVLQSKEI